MVHGEPRQLKGIVCLLDEERPGLFNLISIRYDCNTIYQVRGQQRLLAAAT